MANLPPPENVGPANANPYAPPESPLAELEPVELGGDLAQAEECRHTYLGHEVSMKVIGTLHYIAACFGLLATFAALTVLLIRTPARSEYVLALVAIFLVALVLGGLHLALGMGLHELRSWARWTDVVLLAIAIVGLLVLVVASVIASTSNPDALIVIPGLVLGYGLFLLIVGYVLNLFLSRKSAMVFSREYREIIDRTPHIRHRTGCLFLIFLMILITFLIFVVAGSMQLFESR